MMYFQIFRLIESASLKTGSACSEILLDEWGTSGRIRPTLGHLLHLLEKLELYRAADFVAVSLLKRKPPKRPSHGPAAPVTTTIPGIENALNDMNYPSSLISDLNKNNERLVRNFDKDLEEMSYRSSLYENINNESFDTNLDRKVTYRAQFSSSVNKVKEFVIPKIVVSDVSNAEVSLPQLSVLMQTGSSTAITDTSSTASSSESIYIPKTLDTDSTEPNDPNSADIPNLSILNLSSSTESQPENLPCLSALMSDTTNNIIPKLTTWSGSHRSSNCVSPLPNMTLNTILQHFSYAELEAATDGFDETPHKNSLEVEDSSTLERNGRFLGSGAFGSVYLALDLLDRPVAVKKLRLDDVEVVNLDDAVTKQFRNEVEVLCRYEHENLLSLLGYSCDGPTYCLMYEYISGGPLSDRLQVRNCEQSIFY